MATTRNDPRLYERDDWWRASSKHFRSLHRVTRFRLGLIDAWLGERLPGALVVDLGCGGGLLAEPLAERGAKVVGVDLSERALRAAREHASGSRVASPTYVRGDALAAPLARGVADVVLLADVLEHVEDLERAVTAASELVRPGGFVYVNTLNRTLRSRWLAVHVAEGLGLVPRGTHDPELFVPEAELIRLAAAAGLALERVQGESVAVWRTLKARAIELRASDDRSVAYSALFRRVR